MIKRIFIILYFFPLFAIAQNTYQIAVLKYNGGGDWYANPTALKNLISFSNQRFMYRLLYLRTIV